MARYTTPATVKPGEHLCPLPLKSPPTAATLGAAPDQKPLAQKTTSSRNALKHGVCSPGLLPDEDPAESEAFVDGIRRDPIPSRRATDKQIREYADEKWHLRRADRALFILLEYGQEHPIEAISQIKLYPFKEFKRLKSKNKPNFHGFHPTIGPHYGPAGLLASASALLR